MTGNCVCFYSIVGVPVSQCLQGLLKPLSLEVTAIRRSSRGLKSNPCRGFSLVERIKHRLLIGWDVYSQKRRVIRHSSIRWKPNPCRGLSNYAHTTWEPLSICRFRIGRCPNITKQCWFLSIWRRDLRVVTSGVVIYCKTFEKIEIMKSYLSSSAATLLGQPCLHSSLDSIVVSLFTNRETAMLSTLPHISPPHLRLTFQSYSPRSIGVCEPDICLFFYTHTF